MLEYRRAPFREVQKILQDDGVQLSVRTLKRRSAEAGLKSYRPTKRPKLTKRMRGLRLDFAKQFRSFTISDWGKVLFSDESTLRALTESYISVRRRPHEKYHPSCVQETVKHPPSVMVWSVVSGKGAGPLYFVEGSMNQHQYLKVLHDVFLPYKHSLETEGDTMTFMQDNAPCHTAKSVKNFFSNHDIRTLPWPPNSPDINPIENVWRVLKQKVYERKNPTKDTLIQNIREVWQDCPLIADCIRSCVQSMPRRIASVIKSKGGWTKY